MENEYFGCQMSVIHYSSSHSLSDVAQMKIDFLPDDMYSTKEESNGTNQKGNRKTTKGKRELSHHQNQQPQRSWQPVVCVGACPRRCPQCHLLAPLPSLYEAALYQYRYAASAA